MNKNVFALNFVLFLFSIKSYQIQTKNVIQNKHAVKKRLASIEFARKKKLDSPNSTKKLK